jgi:branched-chain amino acid transport system permease protein
MLLPLAGAMAAIVGLLVSLPTLKLKGIFLAIVTLGFSEIIRLIALNWISVTGGPLGIKGIPPVQLFGLKTTSPHVYYYIALFVVVLCLVSSYRVIHSRIGRAWISIREDELAAKSLGVRSKYYKAMNFMFGAFWAGIGGALMSPYYRFISSDMFSVDEGFNILSMVIIGGQGTLVGPVVGAIVVNGITEVFRFASDYRMLIYASLIIAMMWLRPQGIAGASNTILAGKAIRKNPEQVKRKKNEKEYQYERITAE